MLDYGLLLSIAATLALPALLTWRYPLRTTNGHITDVALGALGAGLIAGRVVSLAIDDPRSLTRLGDFLLIRSGVEFWVGVAAGVLVIVRAARREQVSIVERLADMVPAALAAQAGFFVACLVRDGCYGPGWSSGPTPKGLSHGMLPVELIGGLALAGVAVVVASRVLPAPATIIVGVGTVASVRALTSIWLPRLGTGLTRQHVASIAIAGVCALALVAVGAASRGRSRHAATATPLAR